MSRARGKWVGNYGLEEPYQAGAQQGQRTAHGFSQDLKDCYPQDLACLAKVVSQNQDLAGVRPSLMAASLLVADRQAHGELPSWPSCLARLTGYAPSHLQDLVNAHLPALR